MFTLCVHIHSAILSSQELPSLKNFLSLGASFVSSAGLDPASSRLQILRSSHPYSIERASNFEEQDALLWPLSAAYRLPYSMFG